jgi:hypothetical protein
MLSTEIILIILLLLVGLPLINYNFKIVLIIIIAYLLLFPEQRILLTNQINQIIPIDNISGSKNNRINDPQQNINKLNILIDNGHKIIKELKIYKGINNTNNKSVYLSIKFSWKNLSKLALNIIEKKNQTHQHHIFSTLIDQRKFIIEQMASMIVGLEPLNIKENTNTVDPNLPQDQHIRSLIRKMSLVLDNIFELIKKQINLVWEINPSTEISPVEWGAPEPHNS